MAGPAMFFGEIVEPYSRAFLDDDEDEVNPSLMCRIPTKWEISFNWISKPSEKSTVFITCQGNVARVFAEQYLLGDATLVATVDRTEPEIGIGDRKRRKKVGAGIYQLPCKVMICVIYDVPDVEGVPFVESLAELLSDATSNVMILYSLSRNKFYSQGPLSEMEESFLRCLSTTPAPPALDVPCPWLEIPNLLAGASPGVLLWCQKEKIKARLIACYTEESVDYIDSRTMAPLISILSSTPLNMIARPKEKFKLAAIFQNNVQTGNMYL